MASNVEICNRALQRLGASRIINLTENSVNARACNAAFESVKLAELRAHPWSFAIKRAELNADAMPPAFGKQNSFQLPSDFIRLINPDPEWNLNSLDWQIEGRKIFTNDSAPLQIRYIANVTDPVQMDSLFREAFSCKLAFELCEELTQSNPKKESLRADYKEIISQARLTNAIEKVADQPPEDEWVTVRQ